jgi:hypothetical protein
MLSLTLIYKCQISWGFMMSIMCVMWFIDLVVTTVSAPEGVCGVVQLTSLLSFKPPRHLR